MFSHFGQDVLLLGSSRHLSRVAMEHVQADVSMSFLCVDRWKNVALGTGRPDALLYFPFSHICLLFRAAGGVAFHCTRSCLS